ncbi:hypothetical protein MMC29_003326, partial [Sticta canariensis]|nr:hypothetical protein [Sticta canariensis]
AIQAQTAQAKPDTGPNKARKYGKDKKRPNVHVSIYYADTIEELALASNSNMLIGENKHR